MIVVTRISIYYPLMVVLIHNARDEEKQTCYKFYMENHPYACYA
jgi:hypothetical protein